MARRTSGIRSVSTTMILAFCYFGICKGMVPDEGPSQCVQLISRATDSGNKLILQFFRDKILLPQFYRQQGVCKDVVRTRSVKIDGLCSNIEIYTYDEDRFRECLNTTGWRPGEAPMRSAAFRRCNWTKKTVRSTAVVRVRGAKPGVSDDEVLVKLYTQADCTRGWIMQGTMTIKRPIPQESDDDDNDDDDGDDDGDDDDDGSKLASCLMLSKPRDNGTRVVMSIFRDEQVLPHLYAGKGACRRIVHTDSISVNGVCSTLDLHIDKYDHFQSCRRKFRRDALRFKRCFWNKSNVSYGGLVNATRAYQGNQAFVAVYDYRKCRKRLAWGMVKIE